MPDDVSWKSRRCDHGSELLTDVEDRITGAEEIKRLKAKMREGSPLS